MAIWSKRLLIDTSNLAIISIINNKFIILNHHSQKSEFFLFVEVK